MPETTEQKCSHCQKVIQSFNLHIEPFIDGPGSQYYHIYCWLTVLTERNHKLRTNNHKLRKLLEVLLEGIL